MKKLYTALLFNIIFFSILSCEKGELDPSLPPIIETTSSIDAESRISKLANNGESMDFLIDLQEDDIWRACYETGNYDNVFAYGIEARIIVDQKQRKVDKKLRNIVTVYTGYRFKIYGHSNYIQAIYNNGTIRFFKVSTKKSSFSPNCTTLGYYFPFAQEFGGTFMK